MRKEQGIPKCRDIRTEIQLNCQCSNELFLDFSFPDYDL